MTTEGISYEEQLKEQLKARRRRFTEAAKAQQKKLREQISSTRELLTKPQIMEAPAVPLEPVPNHLAEQLNPKMIIGETCKYFSVRVEDVMSVRRRTPIAFARQISVYMVYYMTNKSLPSIGRIMDRDHTTILYAVRKIEALLQSKHQFTVDAIAGIEAKILARLQRKAPTQEGPKDVQIENRISGEDRGDDEGENPFVRQQDGDGQEPADAAG